MRILLVAIVFLVGMLQPIQAGVNAEFHRHAGHPLQAGGLNMIVGAVAVLAVLLLLRVPIPSAATFASAPWWSLLGGLIGGTIVLTMLIAAPKLGATLLIATFVLGQLSSSLVIDHGGLVGYPVRPVNALRIVGILLLLAGVVLIERSSS